MAATAGGLGATGFGNIDIQQETMVFFAQRGQDASDGLKGAMDSARKDARTKKEVEAETKKLQAQLDRLLAGIPDGSKPDNLGEIKKLLQDISQNTKLTQDQRDSADQLLKDMTATKPGQLLHDNLVSSDWQKMTALVNKYSNSTTPLVQNNRDRILAWITTNTGEKQGKKYIGTPTSTPAATPEDLAFIKDIKTYLNERERVAEPVDWSKTNPQLKSLLSAHFESAKPTADIEDDSVRNVMVQLELQNYNNAINGSSASGKSIHDAKKSVTDRM